MTAYSTQIWLLGPKYGHLNILKHISDVFFPAIMHRTFWKCVNKAENKSNSCNIVLPSEMVLA